MEDTYAIKTQIALENEKSQKSFMLKKYLIDLSMLIVILLAIFGCRWFLFLDNSTVGTLLGATIGYFASEIKKIAT